jgi:uncharacterized protein
MRGNEVQQIYCCSQLVKKFKQLEEEGRIAPDHKVLIIPSINLYSMNIQKRFWPTDNTDINRMFPGYDLGETMESLYAPVDGKVFFIHNEPLTYANTAVIKLVED